MKGCYNWLGRLLCVTLFGVVMLNASAQPGDVKGILAGNTIDTTTGKGIPSVSVELQNINDTLVRYGFITDEKGGFEIQRIPFGIYSVQFSAIGYARIKLDSIHFREERFDFNLGDVKMYPSASDLETVIVYAEKPLIENKDGMIVYNIGESALSAGSSTAEILKTMPLISNDAEGNLLLKGREPRILIDGKPSNLNSQQLNDFLEALPGGLIERIEMMSNPPAEYASEDGGVINIVTKKGKVGLTGRLTTYFGTLGDKNLSTNISYRDKKWIVQITAGLGSNIVQGENGSSRETFYKDSSNFLITGTDFRNRNLRPNLRASMDYEHNKYNLFNITAIMSITDFKNRSETEYRNVNRFSETYKLSTRTNQTEGSSLTPSMNFSYRWRNKKNGRESLNLYSSMVFSQNENERFYHQLYQYNDGTPTGIDTAQRQITDNGSVAFQLRADYNKPLSKSVLLTGGITVSNNHNNNELLTDILRKDADQYMSIDSLSPQFKFLQNIYSFRLGTTVDLPKLWRIIGGAQIENTGFDFDFKRGGSNSSENYFNVLPHFTLRKEWRNSGYSSSVTYRKTIRRPTLVQLNPAVDYSNPYSIRFGNTSLTPQITDNFDWNFGYFKTRYNANLSVGYNSVKDIIKSVRTLISGDKTQTTYENISDRKELEITVWAGYTINRKIRMNFGAGYNYNMYGDYDKEVNKFRNGATSYLNFNGNYIITNRITFDWNIRYNSIADPQGRAKSTVKQMAGVQTRWFNKRLTVGLVAIDPFMQEKYQTVTYGKNFTLRNDNFTNTRNFRITFAYNLTKSSSAKVSENKAKINDAAKKIANKK